MMMNKVWNLCVKNGWYTCGSNSEYNTMLSGCNEGWTKEQIAKDIYIHSDNVEYDDIILHLEDENVQ